MLTPTPYQTTISDTIDAAARRVAALERRALRLEIIHLTPGDRSTWLERVARTAEIARLRMEARSIVDEWCAGGEDWFR